MRLRFIEARLQRVPILFRKALRPATLASRGGWKHHPPVLLDEHNEVGGRYNGGELPTTVIVDAQGNVRRRFVGARNLAVFEAMIAEAAMPFQQLAAAPKKSE